MSVHIYEGYKNLAPCAEMNEIDYTDVKKDSVDLRVREVDC